MNERKQGLKLTVASAIALLLGMSAAPVCAAPPAAKKAVTKKIAKKPVKKAARKKVAKKALAPKIVYVEVPPQIVYVPAPPAPPPPPLAPPSDPLLYRYIDDAGALLDAVGTSPPDQGFRFDGIDCFAWTVGDGYLVVAEPVGDQYRYYLFAPGDDFPFFVGDQVYSYGLEGRALAAVYNYDGALTAWRPSDAIADGAAWLSDRGYAMKQALRVRTPVYAPDWSDSVAWFGGLDLRFDQWRRQPGWTSYRTGPGYRRNRDWRNRLDDERTRRRDKSDWFDRWRRDGYRGPPQGGGNWATNPPPGNQPRPGTGTRPDRGQKQGDWIGRPRPVAPPTPGTQPGNGRPGDGRPGRGGRRRARRSRGSPPRRQRRPTRRRVRRGPRRRRLWWSRRCPIPARTCPRRSMSHRRCPQHPTGPAARLPVVANSPR